MALLPHLSPGFLRGVLFGHPFRFRASGVSFVGFLSGLLFGGSLEGGCCSGSIRVLQLRRLAVTWLNDMALSTPRGLHRVVIESFNSIPAVRLHRFRAEVAQDPTATSNIRLHTRSSEPSSKRNSSTTVQGAYYPTATEAGGPLLRW